MDETHCALVFARERRRVAARLRGARAFEGGNARGLAHIGKRVHGDPGRRAGGPRRQRALSGDIRRGRVQPTRLPRRRPRARGRESREPPELVAAHVPTHERTMVRTRYLRARAPSRRARHPPRAAAAGARCPRRPGPAHAGHPGTPGLTVADRTLLHCAPSSRPRTGRDRWRSEVSSTGGSRTTTSPSSPRWPSSTSGHGRWVTTQTRSGWRPRPPSPASGSPMPFRRRCGAENSSSLRECRVVDGAEHVGHELTVDAEAGDPITIDKIVAIYTSRDRAIADALDAARNDIADAPSFTVLRDEHILEWDSAVAASPAGLCRRESAAGPAGREPPSVPRRPEPVAPQRRSRRRCASTRAARRGLSGTRLLGRAVRLSAAELSQSRTHAGAAAVPVPPAPAGSPPGQRRSAPPAHASRGRAGATGARRRPSGSTTRARSDGWPTTRGGSTTSTSPSPTTSGSTSRSPAISTSSSPTGPSYSSRSPGSGPAIARYDPDTDRYHIRGVMGPDEFHDGYPEQPGRGLDDNAYVNVMAAWALARARDTYEVLGGHHTGDLWERLGLGGAELDEWDRISRRLAVPFLDERAPQPVRGLRRSRRARLGRPTGVDTRTSGGSTSSSNPKATPPTATRRRNRPTCSCSSTCSAPRSSPASCTGSATTATPR